MELLHECPVCHKRNIKFSTRVSDHFLSKNDFQIFQCFSCGLLFTNPRPVQEELASFYHSENYISHSNSRKGLLNRAYQIVRKASLKWKGNQIKSIIPSGKILDIGCGTGEFLNHMRSLGWSTLGVEPEAVARETAKSNYKLEVVDEDSISELPPESFDVVTLWHVLEHVPDVNKRLEDIHRLLKPNGILVLALPNPTSSDALKYGHFWAAWDVPRHLYHFNPKTVYGIVGSKGFTLIKAKGMLLDAFYISILSEKYKGSFLPPLRGAISGFLSNWDASRRKEAYSSMLYIFQKE